jgi:hypothetical protein
MVVAPYVFDTRQMPEVTPITSCCMTFAWSGKGDGGE